jgi:mRNA interferase YafQ
MRTIEHTTQFRRDYKREKKGRYGKGLDDLLDEAGRILAADALMPDRYRDHPLSGAWAKDNHRDCHIRPDLILIYRKIGRDVLRLVRLGSHSELGL